ncbi:hypothetical protein EVAR_2857_1 [Eumeta japonica]|uniref:Uncharacterized protein n=1 Tax=Eumeta variegata TaxID=151549 RepID=A0A4C1T3L5_EUMVA|nr:hypothetical protein EVAR_2857_1 [Eumeta japonica]
MLVPYFGEPPQQAVLHVIDDEDCQQSPDDRECERANDLGPMNGEMDKSNDYKYDEMNARLDDAKQNVQELGLLSTRLAFVQDFCVRVKYSVDTSRWYRSELALIHIA